MFPTVIRALSVGCLKTLKIFFLTLAGSLPLGLVIAFGSMSKWAPFSRLAKSSPGLAAFRPISALTNIIVSIMRGTPLMLQLLIIYYGPGILFDNNIWGGGANGRLTAALAAFIINYACYFSEIYRGGMESIPKGQYEAGRALGLSEKQIFRKIILLQVIRSILPAVGNEVITLVKDTSLSRIIAIQELIFAGERFIKNGGVIWPLLFTGVFYLVFSGVLTVLLGKLEKRLDYFA